MGDKRRRSERMCRPDGVRECARDPLASENPNVARPLQQQTAGSRRTSVVFRATMEIPQELVEQEPFPGSSSHRIRAIALSAARAKSRTKVPDLSGSMAEEWETCRPAAG